MNPSNCIIHDDYISISEKLHQITFTKLKNKVAHIAFGGDNLHQLPSAVLPETLDKNYYVHPECYKKLILAVSLEKRKRKKKPINLPKSKCQKMSLNAQNERGNFGVNCGICKKCQRKVGPKYQYPKPICTTDADKNLKEATKLRKDETLLLDIPEVHLIAKEFKNHEKCYRDYTRILFYPNKNQSTVNKKGDFKAVCDVIEKEVISLSKAVSMNVSIDLYGIGRDQHQYRQYLKERILKHYDKKVIFVHPEYHGVQLVISKQCLSDKSFSSRVQYSNDFIMTTAASILHNSVKENIEKAEKLSWPPRAEELEK